MSHTPLVREQVCITIETIRLAAAASIGEGPGGVGGDGGRHASEFLAGALGDCSHTVWLPSARTIHCNTLQHAATRRNTLQHTATHCNTLQHAAKHCNTLQLLTSCTQWAPKTLQHAATNYNTLQHTATGDSSQTVGLTAARALGNVFMHTHIQVGSTCRSLLLGSTCRSLLLVSFVSSIGLFCLFYRSLLSLTHISRSLLLVGPFS